MVNGIISISEGLSWTVQLNGQTRFERNCSTSSWRSFCVPTESESQILYWMKRSSNSRYNRLRRWEPFSVGNEVLLIPQCVQEERRFELTRLNSCASRSIRGLGRQHVRS